MQFYINFSGDSYGIKSVNGVNRISGEGLEASDVPGMLGGGGKWPGRFGSYVLIAYFLNLFTSEFYTENWSIFLSPFIHILITNKYIRNMRLKSGIN